MIKKIAIFARDRPVYFFAVGYLLLFFLICFSAFILSSALNFSAVKLEGGLEYLLVMVLFLPICPLFFLLGFMFAEWYFNLLGIGWIIGLDKKPFLRWFLRWAGVEIEKTEDTDG